MGITLKAYNLEKRYGDVIALKGISFSMESNILAVLGPNGSGKTTLLSIMAGLRYPTRGKLYINGFEPYKDRDRALKEISFMFERPKLNVGLRVIDIINYIKDSVGLSSNAEEFIERMGIMNFARRKLYDLSTGEAQLLGIFVSLFLNDEGIIILDEPLAHLDVRRAGILSNILRGRGNIIFTTHVPDEAESLADYILVLDNGSLVWKGSREELIRNDIYEVFVEPCQIASFKKIMDEVGSNIITWFGNTCLIEQIEESLLITLIHKGIVYGFKKSGVKNIYVKTD